MRSACAVLLVALCSCATPPHPVPAPVDEVLLRLAPSALGRELHLAQRVTFHRGTTTLAFDAQLEADATTLQLAAFVLGQTVAKLTWDGVHLDETHSQRTPEAVTPDRIMSDVQFAFWPEAAVRAALPAAYTLEVTPSERRLLHAGAPFLTARYTGPGPAFPRIELDHVAHGFSLTIESREVE